MSTAIGYTAAALWAALGVVIARRARGNVVGVLLVLVGLGIAFVTTRDIAWSALAEHPDTAARLDWLVALLAESGIWVFAGLALLLLYFPDGCLPGPRWRFVPAALIVTAFVHHAYGAVDSEPFQPPLEDLPRPFGPAPFSVELVSLLADLVLLGLLIASAVSLVVKFRRSGELRRRQLKWLALAGVAVPGFIVVCLAEVLAFGEPQWPSTVILLVLLFGIPVASAIAMLRHDLYDVDKALATTVAYGLTTAVLLAIFGCASFAFGLALGRGSTVAAAAATALAAVALSPLRRGVQRRVDRRLYPQRQAALAAIADLQRGIHAGEARPEQLAERLRGALREPGLRVGYLIPGGAGLVDETGAPLDPAGSVPVLMSGEPIGALRCASSSPELLREIADAAATLVEVVRLRLEVTAALREVEASRARLVQVGYEERRRLERDLHDGAQQRLVSLGMALRLAQRHLPDADVDGLLDQTVAELGTAVAELRQIAHGLRPSSLDDGLHAALAALTQHVPIRSCWRCRASRCPTTWPRPSTTSRARRSPTPSSTRARRGSTCASHATTGGSQCASATTGAAARQSRPDRGSPASATASARSAARSRWRAATGPARPSRRWCRADRDRRGLRAVPRRARAAARRCRP
jgi:signal transduction histidine kinase